MNISGLSEYSINKLKECIEALEAEAASRQDYDEAALLKQLVNALTNNESVELTSAATPDTKPTFFSTNLPKGANFKFAEFEFCRERIYRLFADAFSRGTTELTSNAIVAELRVAMENKEPGSAAVELSDDPTPRWRWLIQRTMQDMVKRKELTVVRNKTYTMDQEAVEQFLQKRS